MQVKATLESVQGFGAQEVGAGQERGRNRAELIEARIGIWNWLKQAGTRFGQGWTGVRAVRKHREFVTL